MDISSKYRTKCPPKEHEEAVRMLLEGIGKQELRNDIVGPDNKTCATSSNSYEYDSRSFKSSSSPSIVSSEHLTRLTNSNTMNKKHQKATSTSEDSISSSEIDHEAMFRAPIPSRTIAVQCDLKSSFAKRGIGAHNLIDGSMQASSISSTRYGFYNFTPETLENRRRMQQRSVSSRDLASQGPTSTTTRDQHQIEAPTSMSELSVSDSEAENRPNARRHSNTRPMEGNKKFTTSSSSYSSSSNSYTVHPQASRPKVGGTTNERWLPPSDIDHEAAEEEKQSSRTNRPIGGAGGGSPAGRLNGDSSTARARINSLPRRPMTALSYVSTAKLRDQQSASPNSYLNNNNNNNNNNNLNECMHPIKNRAMSQQALSRPRTPAPEFICASSVSGGSDSDSELGPHMDADKRNQEYDDFAANEQSERKYRQLNDQAPATFKGASNRSLMSSPAKPPRPTLISSKHEEQILDYKTPHDRKSGVRPTQQQDLANDSHSADYQHTAANQRQAQKINNSSPYTRSRPVNQESNEFDKFASIDRSVPLNSYKDSYEAAEYSSRIRNHRPLMRPPFVESRKVLARDGSPLKMDAEYHQGPRQDYQLNSMSLSRRIRPRTEQQQRQSGANSDDHSARGPEVNGNSGYYTASRVKAHKLSRNDRAYSQNNLHKVQSYVLPSTEMTRRHMKQDLSDAEVSRSTSMRQINRLMNTDRYEPSSLYATQLNHDSSIGTHEPRMKIHPNDTPTDFKNKRVIDARELASGRDYHRTNQENACDIESPLTRTWANPSARTTAQLTDSRQLINNKKSSRSLSMRDVNSATDFNANDAKRYERYENYRAKARKNDFTVYNSSSESSSLDNAQRFPRQQPLDHDSQHRLNEIGLPEVNPFTTITRSRPDGPGSYLGMDGNYSRENDGLYTSSRAPQITGRALSQQSLTRPTMPLSSSRRRGGSNHSGSDVGGSSMSLVSRLHGRYENAHTRTPVVMYIPKVMPRASSHGDGCASLIGKSSTLRKSLRSRQKSSSQDRSRRCSSRNGSDSESSSMLRTLVRPRSRLQANYSSKRAARMHSAMHDDGDEDFDGIGQLASEIDSYKFRRRYSVPKDAKINWFAKLKQRVSSGGK